MSKYLRYISLCFIVVWACKDESSTVSKAASPSLEEGTLFHEIPTTTSGVTFANRLEETYAFNFLNYPYIYIGGGVAIGDINNDGLEDIYFGSNQNSNKLYLNKGNLQFEDITKTALVEDANGWTTGVSMIDINNDGWLDIYVCKAGALKDNKLRRNKLYVNQKNGRFKEMAKAYGLDHQGFSTQAYFLDYDKDGDLDMYLVNHRPDFSNNSKISSKIQSQIYDESSDHLFRNEGTHFTNVSKEAGILNKAWGLSASIGDFNEDGWVDIYVANDYLEPDMLYINAKNGTFKNEVLTRMNHISFNSMGSDYADLNNDLKPDLMVLDMLAEDHKRGKENMASMSTKNFHTLVDVGYHHQYMSNVLQVNNGNGDYSDIGQLAGITKTDWSWAPLIADFNNDGFNDVFITNGIEKDLGNRDFRNNLKLLNSQNKAMKLEDVLSMAPNAKLANYMFMNNGDLTFSKKSEEWGLTKKVNSNGVAYADLDNDGDLDLVINNENDIASIYRNDSKNNFLTIDLKGNDKNRFAIGTKVKVHTRTQNLLRVKYMNRGFLSSVDNTLFFGLGNATEVENIVIEWSDGSVSEQSNVKANQHLVFEQQTANKNAMNTSAQKNTSRIHKVSPQQYGINFKHTENEFDDFSKQLLLPQKQSTLGPCLAVGDLNNDGLDDFFVGGASGTQAQIYNQMSDGTFKVDSQTPFGIDKSYEDCGVLFFDADGDRDLDIYVASGGYEFEADSPWLQDRLYLNNGKGQFKKSENLPEMITSTKSVKALDFDQDGDLDLVVGGRVIPGKYPLSPKSYILENTNGVFKDVTKTIAPDLETLGMLSDIEIIDYNKDGRDDLVVAGLWMPITILENSGSKFVKVAQDGLTNTNGWYYSVQVADFDNDGDQDFIMGNLGTNNKFKPKQEKPLHIFSGNFDDNESYDTALSKYYNGNLVPVRGKECSSEQTPFLNEKIKSYKEFASLDMEDIYGQEVIDNSNHLKAFNFKSLYVENDNGVFKIHTLPMEAQYGPTLDMLILDIDKDGYKDIIGVGNIYDAEVETVRYDASRGYILKNNQGTFTNMSSGFSNNSDMRAVSQIAIQGKNYIMVANNDDLLSLFELN